MNSIIEMNSQKICEFWNKTEKKCGVHEVLEKLDETNNPVAELIDNYEKTHCTTELFNTCWRRLHLQHIIEMYEGEDW